MHVISLAAVSAVRRVGRTPARRVPGHPSLSLPEDVS